MRYSQAERRCLKQTLDIVDRPYKYLLRRLAIQLSIQLVELFGRELWNELILSLVGHLRRFCYACKVF